MENETEQNPRFSPRAVLWGLVAIVILLSVFAFSKQSLRLDESQSILQSSHSLLDTYKIIAGDVHVPLYHTLLHFWQVFFGNGVATDRTLSLIFFILCIPALYFLGAYAYNKKVALFATVLFSISPFMNWYGNETRMYSLLVFVTILNQYFFIKLWKEKSKRAWTGYLITGLFGIYTHYFFGLTLATQALFYFSNRSLFEKGDFARFVRTAGIIFAAILPWLLFVKYIGKIGNSTPLLQTPTTVNLFNTFSQFVFGFQDDHLNTILVSLWPITVLLGFISLRKNTGLKKETMYFMLSLLFPVLLTFIISLTVTPIFVTRYLIFTLPSMYILLSSLVYSYKPSLQKIARAVLVALTIITLSIEIVSASTPVKENYKAASDYLMQYARPDDIIVMSAPFTIYPMEYYYKGSATLGTLPIWDQSKLGPIPPFSEADLPNQVTQLMAGHANFWILLSYDQGYEKNIHDYLNGHFEKLQEINFSYDLNLYEYKVRY
jgi:mannosyltransferase